MSLDNTFVGYEYRPVGDYDCLKRTPATVLNATHLTCRTVRLHNSAPATVRVSLDNGSSFLPGAPRIEITPLVEVAVGRRPYTSERAGHLVVKVAGPPLLPLGAQVRVTARLPDDIHAPALIEAGSAPTGKVTLVPFALEALPPRVFADLTISVTVPGHGTIGYARNFQRAPPPSNPNTTVAVVDHTTRGILIGRGGTEEPWLPFLPVGWFNSGFTYGMEGNGAAFTPPPEEVSPLLVAGADRSKQWGRKGVNLITMGWRDKTPELLLAELDHMAMNNIHAILSVPTPGHCNETAKPGQPARNCTQDYESMVSNITLVKDHPALLGYYICKISDAFSCRAARLANPRSITFAGDDCCAGYVRSSVPNLAVTDLFLT